MSGRRPPLTTDRRLAPGAVLRRGASAPYRAVEIIAGEPHLVRDEFGGPEPGVAAGVTTRPLLCLATSPTCSSPTFSRRRGSSSSTGTSPIRDTPRSCRCSGPQEALTAHAVDATLRTLNAALGPVTGMPPQLAVTTGDAIDNAQWNEMQNFLALFDGGPVRPDSGAPGLQRGAVAGLARRHLLEAGRPGP